MSLYNLKADGDHWRITKFTADLEVESSYLTTATECDCPAGHRHTCRHRQMLPLFEAKGATRGQWFLDFDRKVWIRAIGEEDAPAEVEEVEAHSTMVSASDFESDDIGSNPIGPTIGHAFTMLDLAEPTPKPKPSDLRRI